MKTLALGAMFAGMWLVVGTGPVDTGPLPSGHETGAVFTASAAISPEPTPSPAIAPATLTEVVQRYCVVCHNDALLTGNQTFQDFSVENADERPETAEKMIRKLRMGMMPPPGIPRPGGDTLQMLMETLESKVDAAAEAAPNLGDRRFQRLTRDEYQRVIRDLLDLEVDAGKWLPPDIIVGAFDNASAGQRLSTTLLDSYLRAASDIVRMAIGNPAVVSSTTKHLVPMQVSQHAWDHVDGTPFGTRGGAVVTQDFLADGEYVFQVETSLGDKAFEEDVDISIDGEPVALIMLEHSGAGGRDLIAAKKTEPIFVRAGQHKVSAAFVDRLDGMYEDRFSPPKWSYASNQGGAAGITGLAHLTELWITGPSNVAGVSETASRQRIFTCRPASSVQERSCAESILTELATKAYRRPPSREHVAELMKLYDEAAVGEGFEIGVRTGLQAILASPEFLFRLERQPANVRPGQVYRLGGVDLATRLSFFLWASGPDEELLEVAGRDRLSDPAVLEQQVKRMLQDPRSEALSTRFLHQWLRLQGVGLVWPESYLFPSFSQQLAEGLVRETHMLFEYIVQEDRSVLDLFSADYTFVNELVAQHYGIEGVFGEEFRRVQYPNDQRQGVLGHGSVLQLTSMSDRTSPVLRGKWVMEVLMGTPPPPPPPNVPAFEASPDAGGGRRLTTRERIEAHAAAPVCNSCHRFIDPVGLALDNFDPTGKWRIRENMVPLDTRGEFYDGTQISSAPELANVLLKRPVPLVRNLTERLLSYAIGRPLEYYDSPTVRAITRSAEADEYKISSLVLGIVKSDVFQMRQAPATAN
jgi:hypothetical protein